MIIHLLYGLAKGETERYTEILLLTTTVKPNIEKVKKLATRDGFHSFRISKHVDGKMPDFIKSIK